MICVEDIISEIVASTNKDLVRSNIVVYFQYGTLREIVDNLDKLTQANSVEKYPLIALIEPFKQQKGIYDIESKVNTRLLIATYTTRNLKTDERLELNFKPCLFPIYDAFIERLKRSENVRVENISHTVINHFEIGRESLTGYDGSTFNDHIDAIEIQDLEINIKKKQCKLKNF
ncbi:MAG: hypothetical protein RR137_08985 [Odoribacter sp.]